MLGVDKGTDAAIFLGLSDRMEGEGRLSRGFWPVDLNDATTWIAANAECVIQADRATGHHVDVNLVIFVKRHDRLVTKLGLDAAEGLKDRLITFRGGWRGFLRCCFFGGFLRCHGRYQLLSLCGWIKLAGI